LWIENDLYYLVKSNELNLTKWVNNNLRRYFSVSSVEEVKQKLDEKKQEIKVLEEKLNKLELEGTAETKEEAIQKEKWNELRKIFQIRRDRVSNFAANLAWINSPKNKARCRDLKMMPEDVLEKLEEDYVNKKESND